MCFIWFHNVPNGYSFCSQVVPKFPMCSQYSTLLSHILHTNSTLVNPKEKTTINYDDSVFWDGPANQRHPFRNKFELGGGSSQVINMNHCTHYVRKQICKKVCRHVQNKMFFVKAKIWLLLQLLLQLIGRLSGCPGDWFQSLIYQMKTGKEMAERRTEMATTEDSIRRPPMCQSITSILPASCTLRAMIRAARM